MIATLPMVSAALISGSSKVKVTVNLSSDTSIPETSLASPFWYSSQPLMKLQRPSLYPPMYSGSAINVKVYFTSSPSKVEPSENFWSSRSLKVTDIPSVAISGNSEAITGYNSLSAL